MKVSIKAPKTGMMSTATPKDVDLVMNPDAPDYGAYLPEVHKTLSEKYAGRTFVFASPFRETPGWRDGDIGTVLRLIRQGDVNDLWVGLNPAGEEHQFWGGEAFIPGTLKPLIQEHKCFDWSPLWAQES